MKKLLTVLFASSILLFASCAKKPLVIAEENKQVSILLLGELKETSHLEKDLVKIAGVGEVKLLPETNSVSVTYDKSLTSEETIIAEATKLNASYVFASKRLADEATAAEAARIEAEKAAAEAAAAEAAKLEAEKAAAEAAAKSKGKKAKK